jgi:hypothetical protein
MIAFGIATTSALTVRVQVAIAGVAAAGFVAGAVVAAGAVEDAAAAGAGAVGVPGGVSVFTDSVSVLVDSVAGFAFSSLVAAAVFGAGFDAGAVNSATGLSGAATGVCACAPTAISKLRATTVNEETMRTGELKPNISHLLFTFARAKHQKTEVNDTRAKSRKKVRSFVVLILGWRKRVTSVSEITISVTTD